MNLFIFFALPLATILLAIVLQRILRSPILVAITAFAIYLIVAFAAFSDTLAEALIAVIIYTIIAYVTAYLVELICELFRRLRLCCRNENDECHCKNHCNRCCCPDNNSNDNEICNGSNDLLTISCNCANGGESDLLTVSSNCLARNSNENTERIENDRNNLGENIGITANVSSYQTYPNIGRRRVYRRF